MQCCFPSKVDLRALKCDRNGQYAALTFMDGSGELHALHVDSQLVKTACCEEFAFLDLKEARQSETGGNESTEREITSSTVALALNGVEHKGVALQAWECLAVPEERSRSVFRSTPLRLTGNAVPSNREHIVPFSVARCSISAATNFLALAGPDRVAVIAARLRARSQISSAKRGVPGAANAPKAHGNDLQLFWTSTLTFEHPLGTVLTTPEFLFVAQRRSLWSYKVQDLISAEPGRELTCTGNGLDDAGAKPDVEIVDVQGAGPGRLIVQDDQGMLYCVTYPTNVGEGGMSVLNWRQLKFLSPVRFFSVLPCASGVAVDEGDELKGWRILVCDSNNVIHIVGASNDIESLDKGAPILPEKMLILGSRVSALCSVTSSSFLVALPKQVCHYSLA